MSYIDALIIKTKQEVFSSSIGAYKSLYHGSGYDFSELKEYEYGDDAKKIDWLTTAKMQTPYSKVMYEEKERNIVLVSLLGGSLYFGSKRLKVETLQEINLLLGYAAIKSNDLLSHVSTLENTLTQHYPSKELYSVEAFAKEIDAQALQNTQSNFSQLNKLFYTISSKSLVVFIGDFLEEVNLSLFAQKHDVVAFVVKDSIERDTNVYIDATLVDNETSNTKSLSLDKKSLRTYRKNIQKAYEKNYHHFKEFGIESQEIYDDDDIFLKLQTFFMHR